jgi:hypothetical protein
MAATNGDAASVYRIFNQGDITALADGWRSVIALPPGRKWITVIDWTTLETATLPVSTWQSLNPKPHNGLKLRRVKSIMRHRLRYVTTTQAIKHAISLLEDSL